MSWFTNFSASYICAFNIASEIKFAVRDSEREKIGIRIARNGDGQIIIGQNEIIITYLGKKIVV